MATPDEVTQPRRFVVLAGGVYVVHLGAREQFYRPNPCGKAQLSAEIERFQYSGDAEGLITLGVASEQMLARRRPGSARFDEEGYCCEVVRCWRAREDGQPYQHYTVVRSRPRVRIGELPGTRDAILAMQSYHGFREARMASARAEIEGFSARRLPPRLWLVVDNTR